MHSPTRRSPGPRRTPLRLLAVALLLGFGLWHGWQCADGMAATHAAHTTQSDHDTPPDDSGSALAGICLSLLITVAATLLLVTPRRAAFILRTIMQRLLAPAPSPIPVLNLAQLGVLRT